MTDHNVGAVVIIDPEEPGPGIITERDVVRSLGAGEDPDSELVRDHLTSRATFADGDWDLEKAADAMAKGGFRHLVVVDDGELAGIISMRDLIQVWRPGGAGRAPRPPSGFRPLGEHPQGNLALWASVPLVLRVLLLLGLRGLLLLGLLASPAAASSSPAAASSSPAAASSSWPPCASSPRPSSWRPAALRACSWASVSGWSARDRREAGDVDLLAVGDDRVERAARAVPDLLAGAGAERGRVALAPVRVVDEAADDRRGAGDLAAVGERPASRARAGVERVEGAVVAAEVDGRLAARDRRHRGRRVHVRAGPAPPRELPRLLRERVHVAVGVADVDAPVRDGRRGVEVAGGEAEVGAARAGVPDLLAGVLVDRVDLAAVGAEVELALGQREPALDGAAGAEPPRRAAAVVEAHRVDLAVLAAEVDVVVDDHRRRLRAARQRLATTRPCRSWPTARRRARRRPWCARGSSRRSSSRA